LPVTPFHYPIAYVIYKLGGKLSLPAVIVGLMVPDMEIPFIVLLLGTEIPHRLVLHSLPGTVTAGTILSVAIIIFVNPWLISALLPIDKRKVKEKCRFTFSLVFSCVLGGLSHVLLDVTNHAYNPVSGLFLH
jgi:membrane-bound metal-dependent hydrolase YbcI (DUF457 family)